MRVGVRQAAAPDFRGGKSGLHRAGRSVTRSPGDRRKVPQKIYRPFLRGKGEKVG